MREQILRAFEALKGGEASSALVTDTIRQIRELPRDERKVLDMTCVSENVYEAGSVVYPFCMHYETEYNGKAGYFDLMDQLRVLSEQADGEFTIQNASYYLEMMVKSIAEISPQIYELYHELVVLFRARMKRAIEEFRDAPSSEEKKRIGACIKQACDMDLVLSEKYLETAESFQA